MKQSQLLHDLESKISNLEDSLKCKYSIINELCLEAGEAMEICDSKPVRIAYFFLLHKDAHAFKILLDAVWHPYHLYLVHIDAKCDVIFKGEVNEIISSKPQYFKNVKVMTKSVSVVWGGISIVTATLLGLK